ncbi:MAG: antibiotic biosynthesis monooxygenase [Chitinophagaceae bacterium]|nr:antibiotic biosynthesis monooxygenase [Chitinophagaceae bacterium]
MYQLIAKWTILPGKKDEAFAAIKQLAAQVKEKEPDTLVYIPQTTDYAQMNLPLPYDGEIVFFECYKDKDAFLAHLNGEVFTGFVKQYGHLFLSGNDGSSFVLVQTLTSLNGFIRTEAATAG